MKLEWAGKDISSTGRLQGVSGWQLDGERDVQVIKGIRAVEVTPVDRQNTATSLKFTVTRDHDTIEAAELFAMTHELELANKGVLVMTASAGQANQAVVYLKAQLKNVSVKYEGMLSMTTYTFMGGKTATKRPT